MPAPQHSGKTALVLAGGGSFGAVQVGMLKALVAQGFEQGLKINMVVGSSVGAINGAYFAGDPTLRGVELLEQVWRALRRRDLFPLHWRTLLGFARRRDFLISSMGLRDLVARHLPFRNLEDARISLHIIATDLLSGEPVVLSRGNASDAIVASSAIPAAFAPVKVGDRYLIDGAIASNTPVKVAVALGARRIIVLPTGFACALKSPPAGALSTALHALTLLIARQLVSELESLSDDVDYAIVPSLCPLSGSPYDFSHTGSMIDAAHARTLAWIAEGGLASRAIPDGLRVHKHQHA